MDFTVKKLYNNFMANVSVSVLKQSDESAWQAYVNAHPDATIYHTLEWRDIIYNEYRFEPVYLIAKSSPSPSMGEGRGEGERVVGVFPMFLVKNLRGRRFVSLPFSIYGGPLGDTDEAIAVLLKTGIEMVKNGKAASIEVKPYKHIDVDIQELASNDWMIGTTVNLTVGIDGLWKNLTDKNDVNRATREGLIFSLSDGEGVDRFYKLQLMTRKRLGLPTPSLKYHRSFFENMPGLVKLALVEKEGVPVAGGIFFIYNDTVLHALGASDKRYLYSRPNDLLLWEMMKWAASGGYKKLDLGTVLSEDKGLLHFKRKWGGIEILVKRYLYHSIQKKVADREGSIFFKILPLSMSKVVGSKVIRSMG